MMNDSQAPIQFWGEAGNTAVYIHQGLLNEGRKRHDRDGYKVADKMPYGILNECRKPTHDADGNEISYRTSVHNLC